MRLLCLDIGAKRIGIAGTDPLGLTAQPLTVITRHGDARDFEAIACLCRKRGVEMLIAGLPLDMEGGEGAQSQKVRAFMQRLDRFLRDQELCIPISFQDERFSTATAEEQLIAADVSRARRRKVIDKMAAVAILTDYLEAHDWTVESNEGVRG